MKPGNHTQLFRAMIDPSRQAFFRSAAIAAVVLLAAGQAGAQASATDAKVGEPAGDARSVGIRVPGRINSDQVYVRSGSSESEYPVMKLNSGDRVTVVGAAGDWLKVLPPEGTFCVVANLFVEQRGDGRVGRIVSDGPATVKIGSLLVPLRIKPVASLPPGTDVQVLGQEDHYLKIAPPEGVVLYINKRFVDPVKDETPPPPAVNVAGTGTGTGAETTGGSENTARPQGEKPGTDAPKPNGTSGADMPDGVRPGTGTPGGTAEGMEGEGANGLTSRGVADATKPPTTGPAEGAVAEGAGPTTGPASSMPTADMPPALQFDRLEAVYAEVGRQPIDQQPIADLLAGYQRLVDGKKLPESMTQLCTLRVTSLRARAEAREQYEQFKTLQASMQDKQKPLVAEAVELQERVEQNQSKRFAAAGVLRPSSLQGGGKRLLRLTDPQSGRTVIYLRSNDAQLAAMDGQMIAVAGDVQTDERMKIKSIEPQSYEAVSASDLTGGSIVVDVMPPSILAGKSTASGE